MTACSVAFRWISTPGRSGMMRMCAPTLQVASRGSRSTVPANRLNHFCSPGPPRPSVVDP